MKVFWAFWIVLASVVDAWSQEIIAPGVYHAPEVSKKRKLEPFMPVITGSTDYFRSMEVYYVTTSVRFSHLDQTHDVEELVVVTDGRLEVTINDQKGIMTTGGVAVILPGDRHSIENADDNPVSYFLITYASKEEAGANQIDSAGDSEILKFDSVGTNADYGRRYGYPERATVMCPHLQLARFALNTGSTQSAEATIATTMLLVSSGMLTLQSGHSSTGMQSGDVAIVTSGQHYLVKANSEGQYVRIILP